VSDTLSVYAGLRESALRTHVEGTGIEPVENRSQALGPVVQVLWKPAGANGGDQARFALSRTYKAPRTRDLVPRRYVAFDNTPTTPDLQGNPELRPELAWGLDLAFERYLANDAGMLGVSAAARRIEDVILDKLFQDANGVWISTKANQGEARVYTLQLDTRLRPAAVWPDAPGADLRMTLARNWSFVDSVPGPDNRLDSQVPWSATFGADGRVGGGPLSWGANLALQGGVRARTSETQETTTSTRRTLDLFAAWKPAPGLQWRASLSNALRRDEVTNERVFDASGSFAQTTTAPSFATFRLSLEVRP
jgi:outer membrane receptor protein involved in Fe transport